MHSMLYDVWVSFIGAFLGFLFALLSEMIISKIVGKQEIKSYMRNIRKELQAVYEALEEHKDSRDLSLMFDLPIWEAFVLSGEIRELLNTSFYVDLLTVYSKLKKANELEANDPDNDDAIISKRNEVYQCLTALFVNEDFIKQTR